MEKRTRVFISYKRDVQPDDSIASELYRQLCNRYDVFIDKTMLIGEDWGKRIEEEIRKSDFFVSLISEASVKSDMVVEEITIAHRLANEHNKPSILPIRLNYLKSLEYPLGAYLNKFNWFLWKDAGSTPSLVENLVTKINKEKRNSRKKHTVQDLASKILRFQGTMQRVIDQVDEVVDDETTRMCESFSNTACPDILEQILRRPVISWRRREIKTLNEITEVAENNLSNWMESERARQIIDQNVEAWISSIEARITNSISPIYVEFHIQADLPTIFPKLPSESNTFGQEEIRSIAEDSGFKAVTDNIKTTIAMITGFVAGGVVVALLPTGPTGELGVVLLGLIIFAIGSVAGYKAGEALEKVVSRWNLPLFLRKRVSDERIDELMTKGLPEFKEKLQKQLNEELHSGGFSSQITKNIKEAVFSRVDEIVADWLDR